eukprot:CCRYP_003264-RA/>CCRYP_003264-RA protein AED:0.07 eAED:0.07 QI:495/1/1/1/0.66/0.5/4/69/781
MDDTVATEEAKEANDPPLSDSKPSSPSPTPPNRDSASLCSSCDPCRARKTKCDGLRPCRACVSKHAKKHKLSSYAGITAEDCGCTYSVAKRRGPVPGFKNAKDEKGDGKLSTSKKRGPTQDGTLHSYPPKKKKEKRSEAILQNHPGSNPPMGNGTIFGGNNFILPLDPAAAALQQQILSGIGALGLGLCANFAGGVPGFNFDQRMRGQDAMAAASDSARQQLGFIERLQQQQQELQRQQQQQMQMQQMAQAQNIQAMPFMSRDGDDNAISRQMSNNYNEQVSGHQPSQQFSSTEQTSAVGCEKTTVRELLHVLDPKDPLGSRFRACYGISFGSIFGLPPILTYDEYCRQFTPPIASTSLPKYDVAALQAAQFAELALGALADGDRCMMFALINASIFCLQDTVKEPVHRSCQFELAKAFFFHSLIRCHNGDMERYFKYRRAAMHTLAHLDGYPSVETLMAAVGFQDALAFMLYDGCDDDVPDIDSDYPQVLVRFDTKESSSVSFTPSKLASDPTNKTWITGPPMFSSESSAPLRSRVLDILACATRSFVEESQFKKEIKSVETSTRKRRNVITAEDKKIKYKICLGHLNEAGRLLAIANCKSSSSSINDVHHVLVMAFRVMINEDTSEPEESQVQNAFHVLKAIIKQPSLLNLGPTNIFVHKCVIFIACIINKLHKAGLEDQSTRDLFEESIDLYHASRTILNIHNSKLPDQLRCHEIPRPKSITAKECDTIITLDDESMMPHRMGSVKEETGASTSDTEKECHINDKAFLVFLSGLYLAH